MKMTNEQIQTILDGAPDGATHIEVIEDEPNEYWMLNSDECLWHWHKNPKDPNRTWRIGIPELTVENIHDLSDLREILELRREVEWLKSQQSEVAARAVEDAVMNTPTHRMKVDERLYHSQRALLDYANQLREQGNE